MGLILALAAVLTAVGYWTVFMLKMMKANASLKTQGKKK